MSIERRYSLLRHQHTLADLGEWGLLSTSGNRWGVLASVIQADGVMEIGKYIDFHETDADVDDYDYRLTSVSGRLEGSGNIRFGVAQFEGATGALPALGYHNAATSLSLRNGADATYGLAAGVISTGVSWIQSGRADGTATAYNLALQPLGGDVVAGGSTNYSTLTSDGKAVLRAASSHLTLYDTNGTDTADYSKYEVDAGFASIYMYDASAAVSRRPLSAELSTGAIYIGTDANSAAVYIGNTGGIYLAGYNSWSGSGWGRVLRLDSGAGSAAMSFDDASGTYWGIGQTTGDLYFMYTTADGSGGAGQTYPLYHDGTNWNVITQQVSASHISVPSGYAFYVNGMAGTAFLAYNDVSSYGSVRIGGSKGGYSGTYLPHSGMIYMFDSSKNGGPYNETAASWQFYHVDADDCTVFGGTGSSASYKIYVYGSAYASGTWTASDERKKRDIKTIPYALDRVCAMRGVEYRWREDADVGQDPETYHVGLIAQEVEQVVPEAVHYAHQTDAYAVDYSGLVGLLIQAVKELREELNEYKTRRGG